MLYYVSGTVTLLEPGLAVIDCGGVGYGCRITAYTAGQLKLNQQAKLLSPNPSGRMPLTCTAFPAGRNSAAMNC